MKNIDPNKVAVSVRWSTEDQGDGTTLQVQLEGCKHYILSQGWNINESLIFIDDGYSGGNLNRPGITKLREAVQQGLIDCVVVFKLDRLSRSVIDTVNLVLAEWEGKTYLKSAREPIDTTTPMGKQFFYMLVSFAEWERSVIKERTFSGKVTRAKEGKNSGFTYSYGYRKGSTEPYLFEIVPEEALIVKKIYSAYLSGRGAFGIAADLNEAGITTRDGQKWSGNTILYMLRNKIYIGILEYGKTIKNPIQGEALRIKSEEYLSTKSPYIEIIIPLEMFNAVQDLRISRNVKVSKISGRALSSQHLLSGILKCKCGHSYIGNRVKKGDTYAYYECSGKKQKGSGFCDSGLIRKDIIDKIIIDKVQEKFFTPKQLEFIETIIKEKFNDHLTELQHNIQHIEAHIVSLTTQLNHLDQDYRNQKIDAQTYSRLYNQIDEEKRSANLKLTDLQKSYSNNKIKNISVEKIELAKQILNKWFELPIAEQKVFLRNWINYIVVYRKAGKYNAHIEIEINYVWDKDL